MGIKWNACTQSSLYLNARQIHFWVLDNNELQSKRIYFESLLNCDEVEKAYSFIQTKDTLTSIVSRAGLKIILAKYCEVKAKDVKIERDTKGKPYWADPECGEIEFNLSHSNDITLIAVTRGDIIGVDCEYVRSFNEMDNVAEDIMSDEELEYYNGLKDADKKCFFFRVWTMKEAYYKCEGMGIIHGVKELELDTTIHKEGSSPANPTLSVKRANGIQPEKDSLRSYAFDYSNEYYCAGVNKGPIKQTFFHRLTI